MVEAFAAVVESEGLVAEDFDGERTGGFGDVAELIGEFDVGFDGYG